MSAAREAKIAVVTGGSAGVGRATVRALAERGYDLAILARGRAGLQEATADARGRGCRGLAIECDVADHDAVESAADRVERELGEIDLWVNVAFVGALAFFWDTSPEEYRRMTDVTYMGQVNGTRAALRRMRPRDRGVIINVGSAMAFRSIPLQSAYCGAKHAVKGFTESVRTELQHDKSSVRICMLQLPGLNTPQFDWNLNRMTEHPMPVPPIFQPELPARAIAFLAEHPRRQMWVGISTATRSSGSAWRRGWPIYISRAPESTASRSMPTSPAMAPTSSRPATTTPTEGLTGRSTTGRTHPILCCGYRCIGVRSFPPPPASQRSGWSPRDLDHERRVRPGMPRRLGAGCWWPDIFVLDHDGLV